LVEADEESKCVRDFQKYSDSVAILTSLYNLFSKKPELGRYVGIEKKLFRKDGRPIVPDFVVLYDENTKGLLFELKWSLPDNPTWLLEEIKDLEKYFEDLSGWTNDVKNVEFHDLVLICHISDIKKVVKLVEVLCTSEEFSFLRSGHFAIWGWSIVASKKGQREEELRIEKCYGKIRNIKIEQLLNEPAGIIISENVLQYLRWIFFFIKQKPPLTYIIAVLMQHILNAAPLDDDQKTYKINLDVILERSKIFFPSWDNYDNKTKQFKRNWIIEALDNMVRLDIIKKERDNIYEIPKPIYKKRIPLQEALCKDILKMGKIKQRKRYVKKTTRLSSDVKVGVLDDFFKKER